LVFLATPLVVFELRLFPFPNPLFTRLPSLFPLHSPHRLSFLHFPFCTLGFFSVNFLCRNGPFPSPFRSPGLFFGGTLHLDPLLPSEDPLLRYPVLLQYSNLAPKIVAPPPPPATPPFGMLQFLTFPDLSSMPCYPLPRTRFPSGGYPPSLPCAHPPLPLPRRPIYTFSSTV